MVTAAPQPACRRAAPLLAVVCLLAFPAAADATADLGGNVIDACSGMLCEHPPVPNVSVQTNNGAPGPSATTAADGDWFVGAVAAGSWTITYSKTGYVTRMETVSVTDGQTSLVNSLMWTPPFDGGSISGTVTSSVSGAPIEGASVSAAHSTGRYSRATTTGPAGSYSLANVAPGYYAITFSAPGFESRTLSGGSFGSFGSGTTNAVLSPPAPAPGPATPWGAGSTAAAPTKKKCRKGRKLRRGKCVKKKRKK